MGKKQHSKDRMFITKTECATEWGGAKSKENSTPFKHLPFYCCSLMFTPFDVMNIIPYNRKFWKHPVTGTPLKQEDLNPLTLHKNSDGEYHCTVLNKVFTEFTHIVAVKTTGNVFSYEAIKELNIKNKNWKELLTRMREDPSYRINVSGDVKQMLLDLGTEKAKQAALHGGGGSKAQNERAAALAACQITSQRG